MDGNSGMHYINAIAKGMHSMSASQETADFGFRTVNAEDKAGLVGEVFSGVASRYDLMNDLMSGGLHRAWKQRFLDKLHPSPRMKLLDVAGGTGDIAFGFLERGGGTVTISDINADMLAEGKKRSIDRNLTSGIEWLEANAEALPLTEGRFDAYTISFGIRNVTHIDKALAEAYRVLRPGGHFLCLEFSQPSKEWLRKIYDAYSFRVIPEIGKRIVGEAEPYQYLVESIRKFPGPEEFAAMIRAAGFSRVTVTPMTGGVVAIHSGWKI